MTDRAIPAALVHPRPFRLFDATARLLRSAARTAPLLVVLDDLHWADEASMLLLQHLVRELDDERIMLLANARPKRGDEHDVLASLLRERVTTSLEMKGLDAVGVRRQLPRLRGSSSIRPRCRTGQHLVSLSIRAAITERMRQLSPAAMDAVRATAVLAGDTSVHDLAAMAGREPAETVSMLADHEALRALDERPSRLRARLLARVVETYVFSRELETVATTSGQALEIAAACGDSATIGAALAARRLICSGPTGLVEREQLAARMLELAQGDRDPDREMSARLWQIDVSFERGNFVRVAEEIVALAHCASEVGGLIARFEVIRCRAVLAQAQGRYPDALLLEAQAYSLILADGNGGGVRPSVWDAARGSPSHRPGSPLDGGKRPGR